MTKLYDRSEIAFAIVWIIAYTVLSSLAYQFSQAIGVMKSATTALHVAMSLLLFFWIIKVFLGLEGQGFFGRSSDQS